MDKERVKLIIRNMELLIDSLKQELSDNHSVESVPIETVNTVPYVDDYDEVFSG